VKGERIMTRVDTRADAEVQADVLNELRWDTRVDETDVGVQVEDGIVTITGQLPSYVARMAAQEAAFRVDGVTDVANDIQVVLPGSWIRTDTDLAQMIRRTLEWDIVVPSERIHCAVTDGWVTLDGEVDDWSQRVEVERRVGRVTGVRKVTNNIEVRPGPVSSTYVRELVREVLEHRADREANRIAITVKGNVVTLRGMVRTWHDKRAVLGVVQHAPGVQQVQNELWINPYI
jgi:osmotically-inducible protein OsmY